MNLAMLLEMAAETFPDRVAVSAGGSQLRYGELLRAAQAAAAAFEASGCRYVGWLDINGPAAPVALFGAALAGIPYVPLNYRLTPPELEQLLERIAPAYLIADTAYTAPLRLPAGIAVTASADFYAEVRTAEVERAPADIDPAAIAVQLFTSGTTGQPKAAVLRHENLMSYILGTVEFAAADEDDAVLIAVPPYHIAGISAVLSSTYACRRMVQLPNFDPAEWLRLCREEGVSNAFVVPTMLARIVDTLQERGETIDAPKLRALAFGGGKMPLAVVERAMAQFPGVDFTNAYGLTETSSTICLLDPDDHRSAFASADPAVRRRLGSVGRALGTVEIIIRGDDGATLGTEQPGDVYVRGGQVSGEYLGTGSLLDADGWFATRDRGWLDADGYLFLDGRADDVIVRGGENISPGEIEAVLLAHPALADAAVVAMPSEQWGEAVAAAVVLKPGAAVSAEELQAHVKAQLRSSRVPEAIRFERELPYNDMGKLLRRVIRQQFA